MEKQEIIDLVNNELGQKFNASNIEHTEIKHGDPEVHEGQTDVGFCKQVGNCFITINERCDTMFKYIEHPTVLAVSAAHYHTRGFIHGLRIYLKD